MHRKQRFGPGRLSRPVGAFRHPAALSKGRAAVSAMLLAIAFTGISAGPAVAAASCDVSSGAAIVTLGDDDRNLVLRLDPGPRLVVYGDGVDSRSISCTGAGTAITTSVTVYGTASSDTITVDMSGGGGSFDGRPVTLQLSTGATDTLVIRSGSTADTISISDVAVAFSNVVPPFPANTDADVIGLGTVEAIQVDSGGGVDTVSGRGSGSRLVPTATPLTLDGGEGADTLSGGQGDDVFVEEFIPESFDVYLGYEGSDTMDYSDRPTGVTVVLADRAATYGNGYIGGEYDALWEIENVIGGSGPDRISSLDGESDANRLEGGAGNDRILGAGGDDVLIGGDGIDRLEGGGGDDIIEGGGGGDTLLGGRTGETVGDTLSYEHSPASVSVDLATSLVSGGDAAGDVLTARDFENLRGSAQGDALKGDVAGNTIEGLAGDDGLDGGRGADTLNGGDGTDDCQGYSGGGDGLGRKRYGRVMYEACEQAAPV